MQALFSTPLPSGSPHILFRDASFLAVYKPSGMLVHRSVLAPRAAALVQVLRHSIGQFVYPVHRLDRPTSGLILFALTPEVARSLCERFREQRVAKTYVAVVRGWPDAEGTVDHPVPNGRGDAKVPAMTHYRRLAVVDLPIPCGPYATSRYALLELRPHSGRYHQLRRHMKHLSHPIIGDTQHGDSRHNRLFREHFGIQRLLLQSVRLEFPHPQCGRPMSLSCPLDAEIARLFGGWEQALSTEWSDRSGDSRSEGLPSRSSAPAV